METILNASVVVWRESFEALLVAFLVFLNIKKRPDYNELRTYLYSGLFLGFLGSVMLGILASQMDTFFDSRSIQILQAALPMVAAVLLVHMMLWMASHGKEMNSKIAKVTKSHRQVGVGILSLVFLAVVREGFETVIFLFGLASAWDASTNILVTVTMAVVLGVGASVVTLWFFGLGSRFTGMKLFFLGSNLLLIWVGFKLVVSGANSLMDLSLLPVLDWVWLGWFYMGTSLILLRKDYFAYFRSLRRA